MLTAIFDSSYLAVVQTVNCFCNDVLYISAPEEHLKSRSYRRLCVQYVPFSRNVETAISTKVQAPFIVLHCFHLWMHTCLTDMTECYVKTALGICRTDVSARHSHAHIRIQTFPHAIVRIFFY